MSDSNFSVFLDIIGFVYILFFSLCALGTEDIDKKNEYLSYLVVPILLHFVFGFLFGTYDYSGLFR